MVLKDKPKFSLIQLLRSAETRVENVAKSDDMCVTQSLMHLSLHIPCDSCTLHTLLEERNTCMCIDKARLEAGCR